MDKTIKVIKETIYDVSKEQKVKVNKIILFGSRARGEASQHSDWDVLVVVNENLPFQKKRKLSSIIRKELAELLIPCDIIIKSEEEVEYFKDFIGSVVREALKEGVPL